MRQGNTMVIQHKGGMKCASGFSIAVGYWVPPAPIVGAPLNTKSGWSFIRNLKRLWATQRPLKILAQERAYWWAQTHPEIIPRLPSRASPFDESEPANPAELEGWGLQEIAHNWERNGRKFIPLVTEEMCLDCCLDILFLRPEAAGRVVRSGDLDNRLKTLFDALRIPANLEASGGPAALEEESPTYCLLEDDDLISEVHINTDNLLLLPKEHESTENDVFLVIDVRLQTPVHGPWAMTFG
jgi:hypothetical protein